MDKKKGKNRSAPEKFTQPSSSLRMTRNMSSMMSPAPVQTGGSYNLARNTIGKSDSILGV